MRPAGDGDSTTRGAARAPPIRQHATAQVVARAVALGPSLAAIHHTPLESVRLARLMARYHPQLPPADVASTLIYLDYSHGEVVDLLVELARDGDQPMTLALYLALHRELPAIGRRRPELALRLAEVFDEATRWTQRIVALDWLAVVPSRAVVATLRRALRLPHLGVRWQALEALIKLDPPGWARRTRCFSSRTPWRTRRPTRAWAPMTSARCTTPRRWRARSSASDPRAARAAGAHRRR